MSEQLKQNQPRAQSEEPAVIDLEAVEADPAYRSLTEATVKIETPEARKSRERREEAKEAHERRMDLIRLTFAGLLMLGFFGLGVYLFAVKTGATEAQKLYASTVLTAIASGGAGYAFGKKEGKSDKD
ncbi:MAG: hypothetical protein JO250_21315 [Armatimonadetes bacterium]|nr:hypothetical protein [Armatimonadota bacterium]